MWSPNPFNYQRRKTKTVQIGNLSMGEKNPIRVQSMATTDTNNTETSVEQAIRIINAGGELVRFTAQGVREAENLRLIHESLQLKGYTTPLVADIHFTPNAGDVAARNVEKVRINPGNYIKSVKGTNDNSDYTDEEFTLEKENIRERFLQFLNICKENNTAIRIGVNHGSLSERMMNRYGDTPLGMVESCMEFLEVCKEQNFTNVVISMKASNTVLMVHCVRLLVERLEKEDLHIPLHLGVTEAGDGEDGRIKSAVGIGTLLADGIGDTIRVSLSEEPEFEIPVAKKLVEITNERQNFAPILQKKNDSVSPFSYQRRKTYSLKNIGGKNVPVVFSKTEKNFDINPDYYIKDNFIVDSYNKPYPVYKHEELVNIENDSSEIKFVEIDFENTTYPFLLWLNRRNDIVLIFKPRHPNTIGETRAFFHALLNENCQTPVVISKTYTDDTKSNFQLRAAVDFGAVLIDGFGDGIFLENENIPVKDINSTAFGILQAARVRTTKTEYISCPSCGRTLFNLQTVIAKIKAETDHLTGLKIGIMGCIVNGPGEMADADYGYVGAGRGKISLYKKQECVKRNIPEEEAVQSLINLIKENGDWHDKYQLTPNS